MNGTVMGLHSARGRRGELTYNPCAPRLPEKWSNSIYTFDFYNGSEGECCVTQSHPKLTLSRVNARIWSK